MTAFTITEDFPKNEMEFDQRFSDPKACYQYLSKQKWPDGFICNRCNHRKFWLSARNLYICTQCQLQHSLTAGTIMDSSKKPITYWFKAMWWFTTHKSGVNAVNLQQLLGFGSYETAWKWLQKLRRGTIHQDREKLSGAWRSMNFSSAARNPAPGAVVHMEKPSSPWPSNVEV